MFLLFSYCSPDSNGLPLRNTRDEILEEKDCSCESHAVLELWGVSVCNFWRLLSLRSDLVSGPHLQALGCLQVRKDARVFGTLKWGRRSHSQLSSSGATVNLVISHTREAWAAAGRVWLPF